MAVSVNEVLTLSFKGRASREAYWCALAVFVGLSIVSILLLNFLPTAFETFLLEGHWSAGAVSAVNTTVLGLFLLFQIVFLTAAVVRRLHDISYSGVAALFLLIPGVQLVVLMILGAVAGKKGLNRFGPDPLAIMTIASAAPYARVRPAPAPVREEPESQETVREVPVQEVLPAENAEKAPEGMETSGEFTEAGAVLAEARLAMQGEPMTVKMQVKMKAVGKLQKLLKGGKISESEYRLWQRRVMQLS